MPTGPGVHVELGQLMGLWPAAIQQALGVYRQIYVSLPLGEVEPGLKRGRIVFQWGQLQSWLQSPVSAPLPPDLALDLPLSVVAPLFLMGRQQQAQRELAVDENIPDLFGPKNPPAPVPTPAAAALPSLPIPANAPAPVALPVPQAPATFESKSAPRTIGEALGYPGRIDWPPTDIVQATSALEGVAGAVITMYDGFLVAGHLPPDYDVDAFAAFVPELHARVNQCTAHLKLGSAEVVTVTLDEVSLRIQKTPNVYLAVLGRPRTALPLEKLAVIGKHLDSPTI